MVRSVKSHNEDDEDEDEELVPGTVNGSFQKVKLDGKSIDQKVNALRSKHSETEQRRRSKINERFQILRDLIPQNDQKRDKASFLLEVIQYIQFLQEKLQMYEGSYEGWTQEPSKLMPWKNNFGPDESFIDQSQLMRNGSGQEDNIIVTPAITNAQNSVESELDEAAAYKGLDHTCVPANHAIPLNIPLQSSVHGEISPQPCQASLSDSEQLTSLFQSHYWQSRPCTTEGAVPSNTLNEQEELKVDSGEASISNAYSQGSGFDSGQHLSTT
ncbi:hypothetical protein U1Q18_038877 [Sarracenia purpurea var. burkii]